MGYLCKTEARGQRSETRGKRQEARSKRIITVILNVVKNLYKDGFRDREG